MNEQWHILDFEKGYENFSVSNTGKIKNTRTNTILKADISNMGYCRVNLYNKITKKQKKFAIHRLVALYFVNGDTSLVVNHIDGNKKNNNYLNLEWVTSGENNAHAYRTNLRSESGVKNPSNKYSEDIIKNICSLLEEDLSTNEICYKVFNSNEKKYTSLVNHIRNKTRWTIISKNYNF